MCLAISIDSFSKWFWSRVDGESLFSAIVLLYPVSLSYDIKIRHFSKQHFSDIIKMAKFLFNFTLLSSVWMSFHLVTQNQMSMYAALNLRSSERIWGWAGSEKLSNFFPRCQCCPSKHKIRYKHVLHTHTSIHPKQLMPVHKMNAKKMCKSEIALLLTEICQPLVISINSYNVRKYT